MHAEGGEQDGKGNGEGHHQTRPGAAHEEDQHQGDQDDALNQGVCDSGHAGRHQGLLLVVGDQPHSVGKNAVDLLHLRFDPLDHRRGIGAEELDHHAGNHFFHAVAGLHPPPYCPPDAHFRYLVEKDGSSVRCLDDDVLEIGDRGGEADRAHDVFLGVLLYELGADVEVVGFDLLDDVAQGHPVAQQGVGVDNHVKLFLVAADAEDLGDSRNGLQVELDQPVLDRAQLFERVLPGGVFEVVEEHQPHAGRDRSQRRFAEPFRDLFPGLLEPFVDQLAGEVDIHSVFEVDVDDREAEVRNGTDVLDAGQAVHHRLDGIGDVGFDLLGGQALGDGEYLHQVGGDVGKGIDRKLPVAVVTAPHHHRSQDQHEQPVVQRQLNDAVYHRPALSPAVSGRGLRRRPPSPAGPSGRRRPGRHTAVPVPARRRSRNGWGWSGRSGPAGVQIPHRSR